MKSLYDVVIIGADAAVLSVAMHLKKAGLNIGVIEARDRVGLLERKRSLIKDTVDRALAGGRRAAEEILEAFRSKKA